MYADSDREASGGAAQPRTCEKSTNPALALRNPAIRGCCSVVVDELGIARAMDLRFTGTVELAVPHLARLMQCMSAERGGL